MNIILFDSNAVEFKLFAVGAMLFQVYVADLGFDSFHNMSFILTNTVVIFGSFSVHNKSVLFVVHKLRVVHQSVLKLYGVECSHIHHPSDVLVTLRLQAVASFDDPLLKSNVGAILSQI